MEMVIQVSIKRANDLGITVSGTDTNFIVYGDDGTTSVAPVKYIENSGFNW